MKEKTKKKKQNRLIQRNIKNIVCSYGYNLEFVDDKFFKPFKNT